MFLRLLRDGPIIAPASVAVALGLLLALDPGLKDDSNTLEILPIWGAVVLGVAFAVGGALTVAGLLRQHVPIEAGGTMLLCTVFASTIVLQVALLRPLSPLLLLTFLGVVVGLAMRVAYLVLVTLRREQRIIAAIADAECDDCGFVETPPDQIVQAALAGAGRGRTHEEAVVVAAARATSVIVR